MGGARRCDIDRVEAALRQHLGGAAIGGLDSELAGPTGCILGGGIGNRNHGGLTGECPPRGEMMPADPAGPDETDPQPISHCRGPDMRPGSTPATNPGMSPAIALPVSASNR